jgi:SulP family sulfate permease
MPRRAHRIAASLSAGLTVGILTILTQASFATLLYSGPLAPSMGLGFLMILSGAVVIGLVLTLAGSYPGTVGRPHELPNVILALLSARLVRQLPASNPLADPFATVLVMIAGTTFLFGLLSLLMGMGRAGNLFRFLPYPVLGGFVAGSGMLLAKGGITVMQTSSLHLWLPGVAFGVVMFLATRICRSWLTIPACLLIGLVVFHGVLALSGTGLAQAQEAGLLPSQDLALSPQELSARWPDLHRIGWGTLGHMIPDMLSVAFIASLGTLMNASAIEATIGRELDFNGDLKAVGPGEPAGRLRGKSCGVPLPECHLPAPAHGGAGPLHGIDLLDALPDGPARRPEIGESDSPCDHGRTAAVPGSFVAGELAGGPESVSLEHGVFHSSGHPPGDADSWVDGRDHLWADSGGGPFHI